MILPNLIFPPTRSMGDSFVSSPIVRHFSKLCNQIKVPVAGWQMPTLIELFKEDSNVEIIEFKSQQAIDQLAQSQNYHVIPGPNIYAIPWKDDYSCVLWDEQWYTYYDLPFHVRYSLFQMPRNLPSSEQLFQKLTNGERYILTHTQWSSCDQAPIDLVHWRESAGLDPLDNFKIINLSSQVSSNIMDFVNLILNADEIHCVPSCIFCLVDSITKHTKAKLFYHDIRQNTLMRVNNRWNNFCWTVIHYHTKIG